MCRAVDCSCQCPSDTSRLSTCCCQLRGSRRNRGKAPHQIWFCLLQFTLFLNALFPSTSAAQATLKGIVRQDSTGIPLSGVEVLAEGVGKQTTSDRKGRFTLSDLPYGPQTILFRQIGFRPTRRGVLLLKGDTTQLDVLMISEAAQRLEPIAVEAAPDSRHAVGVRESFEDRRRLGFGKFIDSTVLRANEHRHVADLLRTIPGLQIIRGSVCNYVTFVCGPTGLYVKGTRRTAVRFIRPGQTAPCWASIIVDGQVKYQDGASLMPPPELNSEFSVSELEAIEVYRSPAEYPSEFGGTVGDCGLIVFWTRHGR